MHKTPTQRKRIALVARLAIVAGATLAFTGFSVSPAAAAVNDHQIEICHATSSETNEFTTPTPNKWQITAPNGHGTQDPFDIIPPFAAGSHGGHTWDAYPGMNWSTTYPGTQVTGEQIFENGCNTDIAPGSITLDKVTAGDGQPADTTDFVFSVVCEDATVPEAAPAVAPIEAAQEVATDVAAGTSCTIGETDAKGAASTTFSVDGGPEVAGPVEVTIEDAEQVIQVVVTNTFACPSGQVPNGDGGCATDVCPEAGLQTDPAQCPQDLCPEAGVQTALPCAQVIGETVTQTAGPAQTTTVQGVTVAQAELPRTGKASLPLAELGLGLLLMGAGALVFARDEAATA
jgi:hypothetical protein